MDYPKGPNCCGKCELSPTLLKKVEVEHFISRKTHKLNTLRFWVRVWCPTLLWSCSWTQCGWSPWLLPHGGPTVVSEPMVRDRAPCVESLPDKGGQAAGPVVQVANGGTSVYGWKSFRLRGSIKELKDSHLRWRLLW
jgi:hypothetical protein